jgi:hypothetical protein
MNIVLALLIQDVQIRSAGYLPDPEASSGQIARPTLSVARS